MRIREDGALEITRKEIEDIKDEMRPERQKIKASFEQTVDDYISAIHKQEKEQGE